MFPAILMGAMAGMQVLGGVMQYQQQKAAGKAAVKAAKYEQLLANNRATSMEVQAGQERATAQRSMLGERQQGALISGRARALAAASGASLSSPSVIKALADIGSIEDYRVGTVRQGGEQQAINLEYGAKLERAGGKNALETARFQRDLGTAQAQAGLVNMGASLIGSGAGMYAKYGSGGPK